MLYVSLESLLIMIQIFGSDGWANSINGKQDQFYFSDFALRFILLRRRHLTFKKAEAA